MSFTKFGFHKQIHKAIESCGYVIPTPIQDQAMGSILAGRDLLGLAQTGTGKTAAFVLPMLQGLMNGPRNKVRALIVAPTRELAEQIHTNIGEMARGTGLKSAVVYGGVSKGGQVARIRRGCEIIVACPGRLLDLVRDRSVNLRGVETLVLDEADHMFDQGFLPDIRKILKEVPAKRQTMIFSATMPKEIRHLASEALTNAETIQIDHEKPRDSISHVIYPVAQKDKQSLLLKVLKKKEIGTTLVFARTKHKAKQLAAKLLKAGFQATSLQGNLSQQKRRQALDGFKSGKYKVLVATDIAARGIDVSNISHVINFDVPDTTETYTHRTGRTGRAASKGEALTFASGEDGHFVRLVEKNLGKKLDREIVPGFEGENIDTRVAKPKPKGSRKPFAGRKKNPASFQQKRRGGRSRAAAFDFGIATPAR